MMENLDVKNRRFENRFLTPPLITAIGVILVGISILVQNVNWLSVYLGLAALGAFLISFILGYGVSRTFYEKLAVWINICAFTFFVISMFVYGMLGSEVAWAQSRETFSETGEPSCVSRLKMGHGGWNNFYEEGSKYIPVAPAYYFFMSGNVTASDNGLKADGYIFGKAWYVFWIRWGHVNVDLKATVACEGQCSETKKCIADFSITGNSSRQVSIVRGLLEAAGTASEDSVNIVVALSGSLSAGGGPSVEAGKEPLKITIGWPDATAENTFQAGKYKWQCECAER